ncbi:hypothetical protein DFH27DRAFT_579712 [Peziza echinospora]|nr:hypothetical protein DFH27DRAFT_579712 [Peziza echinospora]
MSTHNMLPHHNQFAFNTCRSSALELWMTNPNDPYVIFGRGTITLTGCLDLCGPGYERYKASDVLNSIATWILPLFLLIANLSYGPYGWLECIRTASHLLGDPIDTISGLLMKLEVAREYRQRVETSRALRNCIQEHHQCGEGDDIYQEATKDLATILTAIDDHSLIDFFSELERHIRRNPATSLSACAAAASELAELRVSNKFLTIFAVLLYVLSIITAYLQTFIFSEGTEISHHLPHTIALRELYYWLLPAVILSTYTGYFPSRHTSGRVLQRLGQDIGLDIPAGPVESANGGTYTWRPIPNFSTIRQSIGLLLAFLSVSLAFAIAFLLSWVTPTQGLGCRGLTQLGFFAGWIISFGMSCALKRIFAKSRNYKLLWRLVTAKDFFLFAAPMLTVLHVAFMGWWNNCRCWSALWSRGFATAYINLMMDKRIKELADSGIVLTLIFGAIIGQMVLFSFMLLLVWRGLPIFIRSEKGIRPSFEDTEGISSPVIVVECVEISIDTDSKMTNIT